MKAIHDVLLHGHRGPLQTVQRQCAMKVQQSPSHIAQCLGSSLEGERPHVDQGVGLVSMEAQRGSSSPEASMIYEVSSTRLWAWGCPEPPFPGDTQSTSFPRATELERDVTCPPRGHRLRRMPRFRPTAKLPRDGHPVPSRAVLAPRTLRVGGNPPCSLVTHATRYFPPPLRGSLGAE